MILKRTLIIIAIMVVVSLIGAFLLILENTILKDKTNAVEVYQGV
ncbi:MAG: hypothetical protein RSE00_00255 [Clostridia bacterium]